MAEAQESTPAEAMGHQASPTETPEQAVPPADTLGKQAPPLKSKRDVGKIVAIVSIAGAFVIVVAALLYGLVTHPILTSVLRDIAIIVLALVTILTGAFLAILIFQLQSLIVLLRDEIYPILDSVSQTANTVRGTTTFVSDTVVSPVISAASYFTAFRQTIRLLAGRPSRSKQPPKPPIQE